VAQQALRGPARQPRGLSHRPVQCPQRMQPHPRRHRRRQLEDDDPAGRRDPDELRDIAAHRLRPGHVLQGDEAENEIELPIGEAAKVGALVVIASRRRRRCRTGRPALASAGRRRIRSQAPRAARPATALRSAGRQGAQPPPARRTQKGEIGPLAAQGLRFLRTSETSSILQRSTRLCMHWGVGPGPRPNERGGRSLPSMTRQTPGPRERRRGMPPLGARRAKRPSCAAVGAHEGRFSCQRRATTLSLGDPANAEQPRERQRGSPPARRARAARDGAP
jgi:hypothetical protein